MRWIIVAALILLPVGFAAVGAWVDTRPPRKPEPILWPSDEPARVILIYR